jgi:hypothetical protein
MNALTRLIHSRFICGHDLFFGLFHVNRVSLFRKAHAAKAEHGKRLAVLIISVLHCPLFSFS